MAQPNYCHRPVDSRTYRGVRQIFAVERITRRLATIRPLQQLMISAVVASLAISAGVASQDDALAGKFYRVVDGRVDARTYNGFRRYHSGCNQCHGPDGMGSTFGPSLIDGLSHIERFRRIVRDGERAGTFVMKGFASDPNFAPYIDDIYAYLQARADGALGRGRPIKLEQ
jgi:mono/diheme cytochrome c family protein